VPLLFLMIKELAPTLLNKMAWPVEASRALGNVRLHGPAVAVTSMMPAIKLLEGAVSRAQSNVVFAVSETSE
jgi:hypothetical protein